MLFTLFGVINTLLLRGNVELQFSAAVSTKQ